VAVVADTDEEEVVVVDAAIDGDWRLLLLLLLLLLLMLDDRSFFIPAEGFCETFECIDIGGEGMVAKPAMGAV